MKPRLLIGVHLRSSAAIIVLLTRVSFQSTRGGTKRIARAQSDAAINTANVRMGEVRRLRKPDGSHTSSNARMQAEASAPMAQTFQGAGKPKEETAAAIIAQGMRRRASLCEKKWIHMRFRGPSSAGYNPTIW